jgi:tetratricopeptide (TPR) repeat protein
VLIKWRRSAEAQSEWSQSLALYKELAAAFPADPEYQIALGGDYCDFGNFVQETGVAADALPWYEAAIRTLAPLVEREPGLAKARIFLRNSHAARATLLARLDRFADAMPDWDRARELAEGLDQKSLWTIYRDRAFTLMKLDRFEDAIKDWNRVLDLDDGSKRAQFRIRRALCWARVDPTKAVAETKAVLQGDSPSPPIIYDAACVYALCAARTEDAAREMHAAQAVKMLTRAREQGYFKAPTRVTQMKTDPDLESLRARADFRKLLADLEANKK